MKYANEVIELMSAYPGRGWRMENLVRHVDPRATGAERQRIRNGVLRVLASLSDAGHIVHTPAGMRGSYAIYRWAERSKVPHAVAPECHLKCHNSGGPLRL